MNLKRITLVVLIVFWIVVLLVFLLGFLFLKDAKII